VLGECRGK